MRGTKRTQRKSLNRTVIWTGVLEEKKMGWSEGGVLASGSVACSGTLHGPESAAWELEAGVRTRGN